MTTDAVVVVWPLLMVCAALVPVLLGLREYRRSR